MAKDKKSFVLYCDYMGMFDELSDEEAGRLIKHIFHYCNDKNPEVPDRITKLVFEPIKQQLKRDLRNWENERVKRSEAGRIGGIKSGESRRSEANASKTKQNEAKRSKTKQTEANEAVTVDVTVNDTVTVKKGNKGFRPPSKEDVCNEMAKSLDDFTSMAEAEKYMDYYTSNGWKVGKNSMKDWESAVRNWIRNLNKFSKNGKEKLGTSETRIAALNNF